MAEIIETVPVPSTIKSQITVSATSVTEFDQPDGLYPTIPQFRGPQFPRALDGPELKAYSVANQLYATTSHQGDHDMYPGLVIKPLDDQDVATAIKYANANGLKIGIKSGGHQYSGACSTSGPNIMMDLGQTYKSDLAIDPNGPKDLPTVWVKTSVSQALADFNAFLGRNRLFVPHGQCSTVHIGGHAQTGGYGNLGRAFGLFGDHVRKIRLFDHSAVLKEIARDSLKKEDRDLFNAILGGSPGNFGIITHYHVEVYRDTRHSFGKVVPQFLWGFFWYREETLKNCLKKVAEMADRPDMERNYDLCISVLSTNSKLSEYGPGPTDGPLLKPMQLDNDDGDDDDEDDGTTLSDHFEDPEAIDAINAFNASAINAFNASTISASDASAAQSLIPGAPQAVIAIYAQWVPFSATDKFDPKWFNDLKKAGPFITRVPFMFRRGKGPMSEITPHWLFKLPREFELPYDKRTYLTTSTSLGNQDKWVNTACSQINKVVNPKYRNTPLFKSCCLAVQIQCYGGKDSKFNTNQNNGTSYSWRDSTVVQVLDCFYKYGDKGKVVAEGWQKENDSLMKGKGSCFGEQDRRVLWGSYGDWDMSQSWPYYYESKEKYQALGRIRGIADVHGTFTPNPFAVEAIRSQEQVD